MRWWVLVCVLANSAEAQGVASADEAGALLIEVRKKVISTLERLPRFLCTETIDRATFQPDANLAALSCADLAALKGWNVHPYTSDRLRLDVAVSNDGEMYSWVGENRFRDRSLAALVGDGATSTGAFSSFLDSIFGTDSASFTYDGGSNADGRPLVRFGYSVPIEKSGYHTGDRRHNFIVPFHGTFQVDPKTLDLVRLTIHVDRLPPELKTCDDVTILDYGSEHLDNFKFLLPKEVLLLVTYDHGSEARNRTTFSGCHEFMSEATISFGPPPDTKEGAVSKVKVQPLILPPGLPFFLALTQAIDTATAAAGDTVTAKLTEPIRGNHRGILVPKGAAVTGRIVHIERLYRPESQSLTLSVQVRTVNVNGAPQPFYGRLDSPVRALPRLNGSPSRRVNLGTFDQIAEQSGELGAARIAFEGVSKNYRIRRGLKFAGTTTEPPRPIPLTSPSPR